MLAIDAPFPHVGSHCFERGTARPVTILQRCRDGSVLVRRDDEPPASAICSGSARGNARLNEGDLAKTVKAARPQTRAKARAKTSSRKAAS